MKLRYVGVAEIYGLTPGKVYDIELFVKNNLIFVRATGISSAVPYTTPIAFANNWEIVRG